MPPGMAGWTSPRSSRRCRRLHRLNGGWSDGLAPFALGDCNSIRSAGAGIVLGTIHVCKRYDPLCFHARHRHPELGSGSISPDRAAALGARWMLNQVQHDEEGHDQEGEALFALNFPPKVDTERPENTRTIPSWPYLRAMMARGAVDLGEKAQKRGIAGDAAHPGKAPAMHPHPHGSFEREHGQLSGCDFPNRYPVTCPNSQRSIPCGGESGGIRPATQAVGAFARTPYSGSRLRHRTGLREPADELPLPHGIPAVPPGAYRNRSEGWQAAIGRP